MRCMICQVVKAKFSTLPVQAFALNVCDSKMKDFCYFVLAVICLFEYFIDPANAENGKRRFSNRINERRKQEVSLPILQPSLSDVVTTPDPHIQRSRFQTKPVQSDLTLEFTTRTTLTSTPITSTEALPAEGEAPAGIFHLNSTFFSPSADLELDPQILPGMASGFIMIPSNFSLDEQPSDTIRVKVSEPPAGRNCTVRGNRASGTCALLDDVILGRACASLSTALSDHCADGQVCCFRTDVNDAAASTYDQAPCGQRQRSTSATASKSGGMFARTRDSGIFTERIIGGVPAGDNEICWQAAVMVDKEYTCGGAIIDSRHVITAAHCVHDAEDVRQVSVRIGHQNLNIRGRCTESFEASRITLHDQYDPSSYAFDVAIIELAASITNPRCSCRICLPEKQDNGALSSGCIISGYGITQPGVGIQNSGELNVGDVNIVANCTRRIRQDQFIPPSFVLDPSMMRAVGEDPNKLTDTCDMDTGSSLACPVNASLPNVYKLIGLSSWGFPCGSNGQQLLSRMPTVYANVAHIVPWIKDVQTQSL